MSKLPQKMALDESILQKSVQVFRGEVKPCRGVIVVSRRQRRILVSFRGSSFHSLSTFVADSKIFLSQWPAFWPESKVHQGFKGVHLKCYGSYSARVLEYAHQYPRAKVIFVGHSLGGALSLLGALQFGHDHPHIRHRLEVTTFGMPRIGNDHFSRGYNQFGITTNRITNGFDLVSNLPFFYGYTHVRGEIYIVPESHETIYCTYNEETLEEDNACSNRITFSTSRLQDHGAYWGIGDYLPYRLSRPSTDTLVGS
ncbi:Alpha/Beta hydrolase protein [Dimargaris cristalligena]|uniref:Alpha/Beta hydrolase protein n=1 Tax=Dimargaris cristalligena TaxID=215637 RepID=A0A4P9ZSI0_9FUNG|nr:Alpha/Beta hydrolase protein [Dimargaris cristalligena]|eukprot:RKP36526.1 Alpha/Beta hydrolase protein [Dimargaris cristalligena]